MTDTTGAPGAQNEPYDWAEKLGVDGDAASGNGEGGKAGNGAADASGAGATATADAAKAEAAVEAAVDQADQAGTDQDGADADATTDTPEDVLDATLEAEAAAIIDGAMDEERAEASAAASAKEAAEWKDKYVRLHAEWDTYRRRQKEQAEQQKALAAEKLVGSLIPVVDDLERSINYAKDNGEQGLLSGVEAVMTKFVDTLKKDGVEVIDPKGEAFNALEAQAVGTVDDPSVPDETVADVYQKGYKIGTKVLRPAMVTVTTGGPARPKEEE